MFKTYSLEVGGRTLSVDIDRVGKQAGGCAFMHYGDTTVFCAATASEKPAERGVHREILCSRQVPRRL